MFGTVWALTLHPSVKWMFICTIHIDLAHHIECYSIFFLNMSLDLFVGTRFLATELITWKSQYWETTWFVLFVHILKLWVVVFGVSSFGCNIYNNGDTTFIGIFEVNQVTINIVSWKKWISGITRLNLPWKSVKSFSSTGLTTPAEATAATVPATRNLIITGLNEFRPFLIGLYWHEVVFSRTGRLM